MTEQLDSLAPTNGGWSPAPTRVDEIISVGWLTKALRVADRGAVIRAVEEVDRLETTASKVRIRVVTEEADGSQISQSLVVKGNLNAEVEDWYSDRGIRDIYFATSVHEARFYRDLAHLLPVTVPSSAYADVDEATGHGVVLLEDLVVAGATFPSPLEQRTPERVALSLREFAALHAQFWGDNLGDDPWMAPKYPKFSTVVGIEEWDGLLSGERGVGIPEEIRQARRITAALEALTTRYAGRTKTLIHGDAHPGNSYTTSSGGFGFTDWQNYEFSHWSMDVAYHVAASLTPENRRSSEHDLLLGYLSHLHDAGVEAPSFDEAWEDFRASVAYGYFLWSITRRVYEPITVEMNRRLGTAVADLDSFGVLGV